MVTRLGKLGQLLRVFSLRKEQREKRHMSYCIASNAIYGIPHSQKTFF